MQVSETLGIKPTLVWSTRPSVIWPHIIPQLHFLPLSYSNLRSWQHCNFHVFTLAVPSTQNKPSKSTQLKQQASQPIDMCWDFNPPRVIIKDYLPKWIKWYSMSSISNGNRRMRTLLHYWKVRLDIVRPQHGMQ